MRTLALILSFAGLAMCQPRNGPQTYWPFVLDDSSTSNTTLNTAATWVGSYFVAASAKTVSSISISINSTTGTLTSGDLRLALYSDNGGKPGTEIEGINSSGAPATGWNTISGYTSSVTAGTNYWIVIRNMDATPASNNFTISRRSGSISLLGSSSNGSAAVTSGGWAASISTDSGTNWTKSATIASAVIVWSDGTRDGFPIDGSGTSYQVYSTREAGLMFFTGNYPLRVDGVAAMASRTGSPTGALRFRIYEGSGNSRTLVSTTTTTSGLFTTINYVQMLFPSTITLKGNTWYTVVVAETTNSDASTARYNLASYKINSTNRSLMNGLLGDLTRGSITTDGTTWTDTNDEFPHVSLLLAQSWPLQIGGGFATLQ